MSTGKKEYLPRPVAHRAWSANEERGRQECPGHGVSDSAAQRLRDGELDTLPESRCGGRSRHLIAIRQEHCGRVDIAALEVVGGNRDDLVDEAVIHLVS